MTMRSARLRVFFQIVVLVGALSWTLTWVHLVGSTCGQVAFSTQKNAPLVPGATEQARQRERWLSSAAHSRLPSRHRPKTENPKIALVSSHVTRGAGSGGRASSPRLSDVYLQQHLLNKACYADLWGYDYRFNTKWGFDRTLTNITQARNDHRYWLDFGHWHRVPALQAILEEYDWILYADIDYVIQDFTTPIQSFIKEWELTGHVDKIHVFVPNDGDNLYTFSTFAFLLRGRSSNFTRQLLQHWSDFAQGLCPKGNFPNRRGPTSQRYSWEQSDQPGLWYALAKTYAQHVGKPASWHVACDPATGFLNTTTTLRDEVNAYFYTAGLVRGSDATELHNVPADQPILFSNYSKQHRCGLGVQRNWSVEPWQHFPFRRAFAWHVRSKLPSWFQRDVDDCVQQRGCFARYSSNGTKRFEMGCDNQPNMVY